MASKKQTEISVTTIFDGKQDGRQAFIDLILKKNREKLRLDSDAEDKYNQDKVFSDVRVQ